MNLRPIVAVGIGLLVGLLLVSYYREREYRQLLDLRLATYQREISLLDGRLKKMANAAPAPASSFTRADHPSTSLSGRAKAIRDTAAAEARKDVVEGAMLRTEKSEVVPLSDRGSSSPSAAITSMQWAMANYDPAALARLIYISDSDRKEMESIISRLSAVQQAAYNRPEQLLSTLLCDPRNMKELSGIRVLSEDHVDRDHSVVRIEGSDSAGNLFQGAYYLHKTADGWKWVISSSSVKEAAESLRRDVSKR